MHVRETFHVNSHIKCVTVTNNYYKMCKRGNGWQLTEMDKITHTHTHTQKDNKGQYISVQLHINHYKKK